MGLIRDKKRQSRSQGLILIEAVVGLAFIGFSVMGLTLIFSSGHNAYLRSRNYTQALYLAESKIEEISVYPAKTISLDTSNLEKVNGVAYTWTRKIQPVETGSSLQQIEVTIQWKEPDGKHETKLVTQGTVNP